MVEKRSCYNELPTAADTLAINFFIRQYQSIAMSAELAGEADESVPQIQRHKFVPLNSLSKPIENGISKPSSDVVDVVAADEKSKDSSVVCV